MINYTSLHYSNASEITDCMHFSGCEMYMITLVLNFPLKLPITNDTLLVIKHASSKFTSLSDTFVFYIVISTKINIYSPLMKLHDGKKYHEKMN